MPIARTAFCIFCDDIRHEIGNKLSYMGVYSTDMVFPPGALSDAPIVVSRFAISAWLICDINDIPRRASITVSVPPGRTVLLKNEIHVGQILANSNIHKDSINFVVQATIPMVNLRLECGGFIEVSFDADGQQIHANRLRIVIPDRPDTGADSTASPPAASPQPSEQSPSEAPVTKPSRERRRPPEPTRKRKLSNR
jgi:hypothetical protein